MAFGYVDSSIIDFATGQSESRLRNMQNRLGINFTEFIDRVEGAITAVNQTDDPLISALTYRTNEDRITGGTADTKVMQRAAEYTINRPQYTEGSGWFLPLYENQIALGFTRKALETMTVEAFERELASTVQAIRRFQRAEVLDRLFNNSEFPLDNDGTGATPGFIGSGTSTNVYVGPVPPGETLGTYSHYYRIAAGSLEASLKTAFDKFQWFHPGPFDLIASPDILASITGMSAYVPAGSPLVRPAAGTAEALVNPEQYLGVLFGNIRVWQAEHQIDGNNFAIVKTYGPNDSRNPLAWRYSDIWGPNAWVEDRELYPLANAVVNQNFGIGVSNRTAAMLVHVDTSGDYDPPAITR